MYKNKILKIAYIIVICIGTALVSAIVIYSAYSMFHGIMGNCPAQSASATFPNSYYSPSGNAPQPHILSGGLLILLELVLLAAGMANLKFKSHNYKVLNLGFIIITAIIAIEINKHSAIPYACSFMG